MSISTLRNIENIQSLFTKTILGHYSGLNYFQRCSKLNLEQLWSRRLKWTIVYIFKLKNIPNNCIKQMKINRELRNTKGLLVVKKTRSVVGSRFFINVYAKIWNKLPEECRTTNSIYTFRILINSHIEKLVDDQNFQDTLRNII